MSKFLLCCFLLLAVIEAQITPNVISANRFEPTSAKKNHGTSNLRSRELGDDTGHRKLSPPQMLYTATNNLAVRWGVCVDWSGNVYFADSSNNSILKLDVSTGFVVAVAACDTQAFFGGPDSFGLPLDIAVDMAGNVYIMDVYIIRKMDISTCNITTVAGSGDLGFLGDDGLATLASLNQPNGIAVDAAGNIYVADTGNNRIRKVDALTGIITTVAGNGMKDFSGDGGPATSAALDSPTDIEVDVAGNIYIADETNNRIRKVDASNGYITTVAGTGEANFLGDGGPAISAAINKPSGITVDIIGNVYILDLNNYRIRKVDVATGYITTVAGDGSFAGSADGTVATLASVGVPTSIAVDIKGHR